MKNPLSVIWLSQGQFQSCTLTFVCGLCVCAADSKLIKCADIIFTYSWVVASLWNHIHQHWKLYETTTESLHFTKRCTSWKAESEVFHWDLEKVLYLRSWHELGWARRGWGPKSCICRPLHTDHCVARSARSRQEAKTDKKDKDLD